MENKQPTKEEVEKIMEERRKIALKNVKDEGLLNLATTYFVEESGEFGEAGKSAFEQFKYLPSFEGAKYIDSETGEEVSLAQQAMLESRQGGKRYTGTLSEFKLIQKGSKIVEEALNNLKIQDMLDLMGSDKKVKEELQDAYVGQLNPKLVGDKGDEKVYKSLIGNYQAYLARTKVSEALGQSAKEIPKGLETMLCEN